MSRQPSSYRDSFLFGCSLVVTGPAVIALVIGSGVTAALVIGAGGVAGAPLTGNGNVAPGNLNAGVHCSTVSVVPGNLAVCCGSTPGVPAPAARPVVVGALLAGRELPIGCLVIGLDVATGRDDTTGRDVATGRDDATGRLVVPIRYDDDA